MAIGTKGLTKLQKDVLARLAAGQTQFRYSRGVASSEVKEVTITSLAKRGLIRYCFCGGWVSISRPDAEPETPGDHIRRANFAVVADALRSGPAPDHWALLARLPGSMSYGAMEDAIRYGERIGRIIPRKGTYRIALA